MKIRIAAAGAALIAGLILNAGVGTPASAMCLPLWGTVCRPAASPDTTATAPEAKPHKPLDLSAIAYRGHKRTHLAVRHRRQPTATKQASRTAVTARAHVAAARRLASARRRWHVEARRRNGDEKTETVLASRKQARQVPAVASLADSRPPARPTLPRLRPTDMFPRKTK